MQNIFIDILPPWVETGLQPAFYDLESGTVLQQTARMYAKVQELIVSFNTFTENVSNEIERFEQATNDEIERFEGVINDTVDKYIEKFNDLHDYVEDYFDNLDVQQEINNKLDDMAEQGVLADIISQYLNSIAIFGYDNVASMKSSINLIAGSYARTMGYYSKNDGGSALYRIREITNDDVVDEMFIIEMGDGSNHLIAELITNGTFIPEQLGAKGDGSADTYTVFNAIFEKMEDNSRLEMSGKYLVSRPIYLPSKNNIVISGGEFTATSNFNGYILNSNPNSASGRSGWSFNLENLTIENLFIDGNYSADGIYIDNYLRAKIRGCTIHNPKNCGIYCKDGHEAQIVNTNVIGKANGYNGTVTSTGIIIDSYDNLIDDCVVAYCQWAIEVKHKFNQISNSHFYCNQNSGGNIKLNNSAYTTLNNNYFDGSGVYAISPWMITMTDSLFEISDDTQHIIKFELPNNYNEIHGVFINNTQVEDVRTNQTDLELVECNKAPNTVVDCNIGDYHLTTHIVFSNPYNIFILKNSIPPMIVPDSFFIATVDGSGNITSEHLPPASYYNYKFNGNYVETEWVGSGWSWFFFKIALPTNARIRKEMFETATGEGGIAIYDSSYNFIDWETATLPKGEYYIAVYRKSRMTITNM